MGLDPNIILQGQQYDPMQSIGKAMQLSSLMRQGELQGLQADQARQEMQDTITLRDLYKQHASDPAALLQGVRGAGLYKQADALEKSGLERQKLATEQTKALGEIDKTKAETLLKRLEYTKSAMTGVMADPSDANIAQALGGFVQSGVMTQEQAQAEYQKVAGMPLAARKQYLMFHAAKQDQAISMLTPKLEALDLGGSRQIVDMNPQTNPGALGRSYSKTATPGETMADSRARDAAEQGKLPAGYRRGPGDTLQAIPGGPADPNARQTAAANKVLPLLDKAEKLLDSATGSYLGAGYDVAAQAFGRSTKGAQATAQLKALEGSLMLAQPRMEGPQSNADVLLYRQMAGQIGDSTVPAETRRAAIRTIRELQEKYASSSPAGSVPQAQPAGSLPFADGARVSSGRIAPPAPKAGASEDGYIFLGGDPADPKRWKKASAK